MYEQIKKLENGVRYVVKISIQECTVTADGANTEKPTVDTKAPQSTGEKMYSVAANRHGEKQIQAYCGIKDYPAKINGQAYLEVKKNQSCRY